jgi:acetoin utilization deacetylase AcuC-like enzyme
VNLNLNNNNIIGVKMKYSQAKELIEEHGREYIEELKKRDLLNYVDQDRSFIDEVIICDMISSIDELIELNVSGDRVEKYSTLESEYGFSPKEINTIRGYVGVTLDNFDEAYKGQYDNVSDFAEEYIEESGGIPQDIFNCIDFEQYWESILRHDYVAYDADDVDGVIIFRSI